MQFSKWRLIEHYKATRSITSIEEVSHQNDQISWRESFSDQISWRKSRIRAIKFQEFRSNLISYQSDQISWPKFQSIKISIDQNFNRSKFQLTKISIDQNFNWSKFHDQNFKRPISHQNYSSLNSYRSQLQQANREINY